MASRQPTELRWGTPFRERVRELPQEAHDDLVADLKDFEASYRLGPGCIPVGFDFKEIFKVPGRYSLCQVRLLGRDFRGVVMFLKVLDEGHWVYLFRKTKGRDPLQIEQAKRIAERYWEEFIAGRLEEPDAT